MDTPLINLGLGPSDELRKLLRQQERLLAESAMRQLSFDSVKELGERMKEVAAPAREIARALEGLDLRSFDTSGFEELRKLGNAVEEIAGRIKVDSISLPVTGLFGKPIDLAVLAENDRLARVLAQTGTEGLFRSIARRIQEDAGEQTDGKIALSDVLELSAEEVAALPDIAARRFDPITVLSLILTIIFGLWTLRMAKGTDQRVQSVQEDVEVHRAQSEAQIDSLQTLVQELVASSLALCPIDAVVTPTHSSTRRVHLRSRPSAASSSLGVFPAGTPVQVVGHPEAWARVVVERADATGISIGWIYARYLGVLQDRSGN